MPTMQDLNSLLAPSSGPGWELDSANAINDAGQIVGEGLVNGQDHAFLLTPTPEPGAAAIAIIAGFGLLRRRRNSHNDRIHAPVGESGGGDDLFPVQQVQISPLGKLFDDQHRSRRPAPPLDVWNMRTARMMGNGAWRGRAFNSMGQQQHRVINSVDRARM